MLPISLQSIMLPLVDLYQFYSHNYPSLLMPAYASNSLAGQWQPSTQSFLPHFKNHQPLLCYCVPCVCVKYLWVCTMCVCVYHMCWCLPRACVCVYHVCVCVPVCTTCVYVPHVCVCVCLMCLCILRVCTTWLCTTRVCVCVCTTKLPLESTFFDE